MPKHIRRSNATRSSVRACVEHVFGHEKRPMASVALAKFAPPARPPWPTSATLSDASLSMNEDGPRPDTAQNPEIPALAGQKVGKTNSTTNAQTKTLAKRGIHLCIPFKTKPKTMLLKASSLRYVGWSGFDNYDEYLDLAGADRMIHGNAVCAHIGAASVAAGRVVGIARHRPVASYHRAPANRRLTRHLSGSPPRRRFCGVGDFGAKANGPRPHRRRLRRASASRESSARRECRFRRRSGCGCAIPVGSRKHSSGSRERRHISRSR